MDELYNIIEVLFRKIRQKYVIDGTVSYNSVPMELIERFLFAYEDNYDEDEIHKRLIYLKNQVEIQQYENQNYVEEEDAFDVFYMIDLLVDRVLEEKKGKVVCRFRYLQEWRELTSKVENKVFLAAMYAKIDYRNGKVRSNFIWPDIIGHDNIQLNRIMDEGISDNHFHLMGSVHYYTLSWITLMNHVDRKDFVKKMNVLDSRRRNPKLGISYDCEDQPFEIQHLQAALIRLYLFSELAGKFMEIGEYKASWKNVILYVHEEENLEKFLIRYKKILEESGTGELDDLQKDYPKSCWIIQKILGNRLNRISISDLIKIQESKNLIEYLIEVTRQCKTLGLHECFWIYENRQVEYEQEWRKQTEKNVWKLLKNPEELENFRLPLQSILNSFIDSINSVNCDYAVSGAGAWYDTDESQSLVIGEHWLEYMMFRSRKLQMEQLSESHYNLFYLYLLIKESFRMELQQSNDKLGFNNFHVYQKRKGMFSSYYTRGDLARAAVEGSLREQNIKSLEIRLNFENSCAKDAETIRYYDREIRKGYLKKSALRYYYVMGFGKRKDKIRSVPDEYRHMFYRHFELRADIKKKANGLIMLRRKNPKVAARVLGVDAFSSEDGCRPEVFATAYRVLKKHSSYRGLSIKPELPQLRETYHVGESFTDILDGLRAIDEAVHFLNLDCGDRLGHATVLGMDVEKWYRDCNYRFTIRRQDYLDNIVWLYHKLLRYSIPDTDTLMQYLEGEFEKFFALVYRKFMGEKYIQNVAKNACKYDNGYKSQYGIIEETETADVEDREQKTKKVYDFSYGIVRKKDGSIYDFNIRNYYFSWTLRGDHPGLYENGFYEQNFNVKSIWDECSVNRTFPNDQRIRHILPAAVLNHFYHFNEYVKQSGEITETVHIPANMVKAIAMVQKEMQFELEQREIAIETNPSSNLMINRISSYAEHPIFQLYNKGLTNDPEKLAACPQMNVSINTDDQGVFSTCLSNEYALIASSLSRLKDSNKKHVYKKEEIYQWIKNVQEMGNNQSFLRRETEDEQEDAGVYHTFDGSEDDW